MQAAGPGVWTEAGHDFDLNRLLNPEETRKKESRRAVITLGICAGTSCVVMVAELVVGYLEGSLVLISDGAHQLSDVIMYLALMASVVLSQRQGSLQSYSFGYHRAQVLGSLFALLLQYFLTGLVVEAAVGRLLQKQLYAVNGDIICMIASGSFAANIFLRILTSKMMPASIGHGHSHGGGGSDDSAAGVARLHIVADLLQSIVCISIGATIWLRPELAWLDSLSGLFYGVLVLCTTARIFRDLTNVVMERAPLELNSNDMFNDLARLKYVIDVHCCHVWMLAPGKIAMSAHLHIEDDHHEEVLHAAQIILKHKYGIIHSTLQVSEDEDLA